MNNYDNFFLGVTDLSEAQKYYSNVLGFELKFDFSNKGMIAFNVGNEEPAIILKDTHFFPDIKPTIWFLVDNVKEEYAKLIKKNVKFLGITPINLSHFFLTFLNLFFNETS